MTLAPPLHPADRRRATEVIAVAIPAQPPALAGGFAGLPTGGLGTIPLTVAGPWIRNKELIATATFTSARRALHRAPNLRRTCRRRKRKRRPRRKPKPKKEEEL
jgi:hypothetical protein